MPFTSPVTNHLDHLGVDYRVFTHPGPVRSLEQAAAERGQRPEQVIRSLLFRLGEGDYIMVLAPGSEQVSWRALRRYLGESRLTTASQEELLAVTGYPIGAVAPFGLPQPVRVLLDQRILAEEEVSLGSGVRGTTVILKAADLRRALSQAELIDFQAYGTD